MNTKIVKKKNIIELLLTLAIVLLICFIGRYVYFRVDLTQEKRYTLSATSKNILQTMPNAVYIKVYLFGNMPLGFKKLSNSVKETLDEFRVIAGNNIQYQFIDLYKNNNQKLFEEQVKELYNLGIQPTNVKVKGKNGEMTEKLVIPGVVLSYNGLEVAVNLLSNNPALTGEQNLNNSIEGLEYLLISNIKNICNNRLEKIAFIEGHDELNQYEVGDITRELSKYYQIDRGEINGNIDNLKNYKAIIIAKPQKLFTEDDKFVIDQYLMNGGKILLLIDAVNANTDSLEKGYTMAFIPELNLNDQLFKYGIRINPVLVQDIQCAVLPLNVSINPNQPKFSPMPWYYNPLLNPSNHPLARNVGMIKTEFCNFIDTLHANGGLTHTVLLSTSKYSNTVNVPVLISLAEANIQPTRNNYNKSGLPVAVLVEGTFESAFKNRILSGLTIKGNYTFKSQSNNTRIIIIADGDIIKNATRQTPKGTLVSALGYDRFTKQTFGNKEFLLNAINYLTDNNGLINLRSRQVKMRMLNKTQVADELIKWQIINIAFPVVIIVLAGISFFYIRKFKYNQLARFNKKKAI